jgi:cytochrome c-type biogenesis protein CcmH
MARFASLVLFGLLALGSSREALAQANQQADAAPLRFRTPAEEARFHALASELRCVMCQNQSLADSNALIALNLRREVLALMQQGRSDDEIKDFLVARYGEFVLYKPRMEGRTWLLWAGPGALLLAGAAALVLVVRRRKPAQPATPSDEEQEW